MDYQLFNFRDCVLATLSSKPAKRNLERRERFIPFHSHSDNCVFESIDHVTPNISNSLHSTQLYLSEDNAAVIQMINEGRSLHLRHVTRTHKVDLDWLLEKMNLDHSILLQKIRVNKRSIGGYFDKKNVHFNAMEFIVDFVADQTTL